MTTLALQARSVSHSFGSVPVLRGLNCDLAPGRAAAIIGSNGSGKSTLVRIFAGLLKPAAGSIVLFGDSRIDRRRFGVLTHQTFLYRNLTARENLEFYAALYGMRNPPQTAAQWLARIGLEALAAYRVRTISRGNEQRLAIARALIANPDLLIMDEPFTALDVAGAELVKGLIAESMERGCAVVLTAHSGAALTAIACERYELSRGRLVPYEGT